jgi:hypothetical protein
MELMVEAYNNIDTFSLLCGWLFGTILTVLAFVILD